MSNWRSRFLWWLMKPWVLYVLLLTAAPASAQVSGPSFVFIAGTVINPDEVNTNFADVYDAALNRFGGTVAGHLLWSPDGTFDIGASGATRPRDFFLGRNAAIGGTLGVTGNATLGGTLGVTGATTLAALSATTGSFSSTLAVTGATTLSAALGGTAATFSGTVTGNLFSGSGASLTSIPETAITDGALLARVASAESISGTWTLNNAVPLQGRNNASTAHNLIQSNSANTVVVGPTNAEVAIGIGLNTQITSSSSITLTTNQVNRTTIDSTGTLVHGYALVLSNTISPSTLSAGENHNYNPSGLSSGYIVRVAGNAITPSKITGIAGGVAGRKVAFCNTGSDLWSFKPEDADSTSSNRIAGELSSEYVMQPETCAEVIYDGTSSRWRVTSGALPMSPL